jgi:uncharacterized delta-60 repeat protein
VAAGANSSAEAVAVQGDGKIVAAGYVSGSSVDMAVIRLDSTGALDSSFGTGGVVTLPASMQSITHTAAIQPDGGIVVAGVALVSGQARMLVARYLP